jgi:predicted DNA-binding protein
MGTDEEKGIVKDMKRVQIRLPLHQFEELKRLAEYEGRTVTDLIRQLVAIHLRDTKALKEFEKEGEK